MDYKIETRIIDGQEVEVKVYDTPECRWKSWTVKSRDFRRNLQGVRSINPKKKSKHDRRQSDAA